MPIASGHQLERFGNCPNRAAWLAAVPRGPRVAALLAPPHARPPEVQAGGWVPLLLAVAVTLVIGVLLLAPMWLPTWRRWRAVSRTRRGAGRLAVQRFADAAARGDFDQAETEAERLLDRG